METRLEGKVALVTGSSSGIGRSVALLFARGGATVVVTSHKNKQGGEDVLKELQTISDNKHLHITCDFGKRADCKKAFDQIKKQYGRLDILVNNAGVAPSVPLGDITEEHLDDIFATNVNSVVWCTQFARELMGDKGWVVNTSSIRGLDYAGRSISYAATKAAVNSLTKTMAMQLAPNIFCNAVLPGFTYTPNYDKNPPELNKKMLDGTLIKRYITCDELAGAFLFLVTQEYMTGTLLVADGGATILGR